MASSRPQFTSPTGMRPTLIGTDSSRSAIALGIAIALFLVVFLIGGMARQQGWVTYVTFSVVLVVAIGGVVVAAGNARWNDGILLSWLLIAAPVMAWVWQHELVVAGHATSSLLQKAGGFGVLSALVIGTPGYAAGRGLHAYSASAGSSWVPDGQLAQWLLGDDERHVKRGAVIAGSYFLLLFIFYVWGFPDYLSLRSQLPGTLDAAGPLLPVDYFLPFWTIFTRPASGFVVTLLWVGLAAVPAYRRYGLYVSWLVVFALILFPVTEGVSGAGSVLLAVIVALLTGTVGFVVGQAGRQLFVA